MSYDHSEPIPQALIDRIEYSQKYQDATYEYRHVSLPKEMLKLIPGGSRRILSEDEWRQLGIQQSRGWEHYGIHKPEPHILLFRRALGTNPVTGLVDPVQQKAALDAYYREFNIDPVTQKPRD